MPVKRRVAKRRFSDAAELEAWGEYFAFGWVGFAGDLEEIGVTDPAADVEAAWHRLGGQFLAARCSEAEERQPWALDQFGAPRGGR